MKTQTKLLVASATCAIAALMEFLAFQFDRGLGDYVYLGVSALFAALSIWLARTVASCLWVIVLTPVLCLTLLAANACFAGFIRHTVLNLGEDFGQSALRGIVLFFVILPLTALATVAAATVPLVVRDRP